MRRPWTVVFFGASCLAGLLTLVADRAGAIPAFARKHEVSCTTCHAPFPRLKPFGEEFAARGFRMPDPSQEPPRAERDTGDELLTLFREVPVAVRLEAHGAYRQGADAELDFEAPWVGKVLSGGPLGPKVSYYAYFIIEKGEVEGLEDTFLHFSKLFGSGVDLFAGQFQVSDPLFKRELRLERADYEIYRTRIGEARANLTYDRGLMFAGTAPGNVDVVFEIVNGNGIPKGEFDQDDGKNLALRLSRDFGPARFGVFGYWGEETNEAGVKDGITYFGPDLTVSPSESWEVNFQYLERRDDDPLFLGAGASEVTTRGGFVELLILPRGPDGRWALAGLYNRIDSDDPAAELEDLALSLSYLLRRNVRLVGEVGHDLGFEETRASLGVVTAF